MEERENNKANDAVQTEQSKTVRNQYDSVFKMIFADKSRLLSLYNAVSGKHYEDVDALIINTLDHGIYTGIANDMSFIFHECMCVYEHQSTVNKNMPLRDFFYFHDLIKKDYYNKRIYAKAQVKIPLPIFIVFYNGVEEFPDKSEMRLSDAFLVQTQDPQLELKVTVLNVNYGHNKELMDTCEALRAYAMYVSKIREYKEKGFTHDEAVDKAVQYCIDNNYLSDFFERERQEVHAVERVFVSFEEIAEMNRQQDCEEARAEGREEGCKNVFSIFDYIKTHPSETDREIADNLNCDIILVSEVRKRI